VPNLALREERPEAAQETQQPSGFKFQDQQIDEHPELVNLAKYMAPADLDSLGERCYEEYKEDEQSRSEWLEKQEEWVKLYYGKLKPLDPPWEHASDDHIPILAEGCTQFHARAYKAFFANLNFVSSVPIGSIRQEDRDRAERVGKFMSWQLAVKDKAYKRRKDRLLRALPLHGSYFTKTFRDNLSRNIVVENVSPLDLVANYSCVGVDVEELERKTQCIYLPPRLGRYYGSKATRNYFLNAPEEYTASEQSNPPREALKKIQGVQEPPSYLGGKPAKIIEQHRYLDLDNDGIEEPYIVWVDCANQKTLRVAIRWSWDRWERENIKTPLEYFTHYVYLENPDGFYGFGQGHLVGDINIAADKLLRQIVNAGTLQNSRPGFATQQSGIKSGKNYVKMGQINKTNASAPIKDHLMFLDHPGPSESLWRIMTMLTQRGDRLNMVTDMLTGQPEKVYQTGATGMLIEQGLMVFSAVQIRVHAAMEQELSKIFRLNGIYLDDEQYFVFNDGQTEEQLTIYREDFQDDLQVRPAFDPNQLTEKERKQQVMFEYEAALKSPIISSSVPHLTNATRRFFEGMGSTNLDEIVPPTEQMVAQQKAKGEAQQQMMKQAQMMETVKVQTEVIAKQAEMVKDQKELEQKDQELALEGAEIRIKAFGAETDRIEAMKPEPKGD